MAVKHFNLARMSTATTGTGTLTLGAAATGFLSFAAAGISDGDTVTYAIEDGDNREIGRGVYSSSAGTLTRSVLASTNSGAAIALSGTAQVFISLAAEDLTIGQSMLTPPKVADLTWIHQPSGVAAVDSTAGPVRGLLITTPIGVSETSLLAVAAPSGAWKATIGLKFITLNGSWTTAGLVLKSSTGKLINLGIAGDAGITFGTLNDYGSYNSPVVNWMPPWGVIPPEFYQLVYDGTDTLTAYMSIDGKNWRLHGSTTISSFLGGSPAYIGIGASNGAGGNPSHALFTHFHIGSDEGY